MSELTIISRRDRITASRDRTVEALQEKKALLAKTLTKAVPGDAAMQKRIGIIQNDINTLSEQLEALDHNLMRVDTDHISVDQDPKKLLNLLNSATDEQQLRRVLKKVTSGRLKLKTAEINKIVQLRFANGRRLTNKQLKLLDRIRPGLLDDLLGVFDDRIGGQARDPELATLLPVRIETRFIEGRRPHSKWTMKIRIIPDRPWFSPNQDLPRDGELDDVEQFWRNLKGESLSSDQGRTLFENFAEYHGAARALWLIRTFPPAGTDAQGLPSITRPGNTQDGFSENRVIDFPSKLDIWIEHQGNEVYLKTLNIDTNRLDISLGDPAKKLWWEDFEVAKNVGLGAEIQLPLHPKEIDALYVLGVDKKSPDQLFKEHRDFGTLSVIPPGAPTNTIDGEMAGGDESVQRWHELIGIPESAQGSARAISKALCGKPDSIGPIPGGDVLPDAGSKSILSAIWPAVWGHSLGDIFKGGEKVDRLGLWASHTVSPRGTLPALKIGMGVYANLPVTDLRQWKAAKGDPSIEKEIVTNLSDSLWILAGRAEAEGTVINSNIQKIMDVVSQTAISKSLSVRQMTSGKLLQTMALRVGEFISSTRLNQLYSRGASGLVAAKIFNSPELKLFSVGPPLDITAPLVSPDNTPAFPKFADVAKTLLAQDTKTLASDSKIKQLFGNERPRSLLFELVLRSLRLTAARVRAASESNNVQLLEAEFRSHRELGVIENLVSKVVAADLEKSNPQTLLYQSVRNSVLKLSELDEKDLEKGLLASLDCASHRVDPFVSGIVSRRLNTVSGMKHKRLLGAYGWVDKPFNGTPGPVPKTLLLAPSQAQAAVAALLRDRSLNDSEPGRWAMNLNSDAVRKVVRLCEEVRAGVHLSEAMGRMIESVIKTPVDVDALRNAFPQHHAESGRSTCDGLAVLQANPNTLPLNSTQKAHLQPWREALDAYGDLLVAEAVQHASNGRPERAQAAMDAAAGLSAPPEFDFLSTPRSSSEALTTVLFALKFIDIPNAIDAFTHPVAVAEPSFLAFIKDHFGAADSPAWTWKVTPKDPGLAAVLINLKAMGLSLADALTIGTDGLSRIALEKANVEGSVTGGQGPRNHSALLRLAATVAKEPAPATELYGEPNLNVDERAELIIRYDHLMQVALLLIAELENQSTNAGTAQGRVKALNATRAWGVRPIAQAVAALTDEQLCANAAAELKSRVDSLPVKAEAEKLDLSRIAQVLARLATSDGRLPVLAQSKMPPAPDPIPIQAVPAGTLGLTVLEEGWLPVCAAVREPLARIEALQLSALLEQKQVLTVWSSRPNDHWQQNTPVDDAHDGQRFGSAMRVVYSPKNTLDNVQNDGSVALGLIDTFAEQIPGKTQTAGGVFNFNAPSARPQNAILTVVQPDLNKSIDNRLILESLRHARALARVRMLSPDSLSDTASALSLSLLPSTGGMASRMTSS